VGGWANAWLACSPIEPMLVPIPLLWYVTVCHTIILMLFQLMEGKLFLVL
jgi:hypothetical protein